MLHASHRPLLILLLLLALPALTACERQADQAGQLRGTKLETPLERPDVLFTDVHGRPYDFQKETGGKVTLLFFGYTHCPDICPMHMANIAAVMDDLPYHFAKELEVLFVTVDPQRDTPERVGAWLENFSTRFKGLFVENEQVLLELEESLNLPHAVTMPTGRGDYDVGHGTQVFAFGPTGPAEYVYPFGVRQRDWAHDLPILLGGIHGSGSSSSTQQAHAGTEAVGKEQITSTIQVKLAIIPAPPEHTPAAFYAAIRNSGAADALVAISTLMAERSELHTVLRSEDGGQRMMMQQVASVPIPARSLTRLRPGQYHGMLMRPTHRYAAGQTVPVVLEFRNAGTIPVTAQVVKYADVEETLDMRGAR